ncbi:xaa-Arg dipeptidase-like isoform X2 [Amblyomma americanum]
MEQYRCIAQDTIDSKADALTTLGQYLWRNPELAFAEFKAHDYITRYLEGEGFQVVRNYVLHTAFRAEFGCGDVTVAVLCEYDALPGLGHACGHNLIAQGSVAAGVAVKEALRRASLTGKVVLLGTPAEEGGGGKAHLLKAGAFDGVHAALMAHPSTRNVAACGTTAVAKYMVRYKGRPTHSAASPWQGLNALDAAVAAYSNVAMLRQQLRPEYRVSGASQLEDLGRRVRACFDAGALSSGCEVSVKEAMPSYKNLVPNVAMAKVYRAYAEEQGLRFPDGDVSPASSASTDVGNVSQVVPTIQPYYALEAATSGGNHTEGYRDACNDVRSYNITLSVAKALALTAIKVMTDAELLRDMWKEFDSSHASAQGLTRHDGSSLPADAPQL